MRDRYEVRERPWLGDSAVVYKWYWSDSESEVEKRCPSKLKVVPSQRETSSINPTCLHNIICSDHNSKLIEFVKISESQLIIIKTKGSLGVWVGSHLCGEDGYLIDGRSPVPVINDQPHVMWEIKCSKSLCFQQRRPRIRSIPKDKHEADKTSHLAISW